MIEYSKVAGIAQEQFLKVLPRDEAVARFRAALQPAPLGVERVPLEALVGRVLAEAVIARTDAPPFDRAVVDGFAVQASDIAHASAAVPVILRLNGELIACGVDPRIAVTQGTATPISTGGPVPRGADAVVMIEHTEPHGSDAIRVMRAAGPGQHISFAGSDIARGEALLRVGTMLGAREIGLLAAVGCPDAVVWRKPRVGVISTGDELVQPGDALSPAKIYDSNGPIIAAALIENGCDAIRFGAIPDEETMLRAAIHRAFETCDAVILSGGTSKGAGDLTYRIVGELGAPGIVAHGVALKPGKPLCLAVCDGKPVVVLPGFPTSAMFTFHDIIAPVMRLLAGLPERAETHVTARVPVRIASELGRTEFVMVALAEDGAGKVAHPVGKGSGAVTAFSQADGFITIEALADALPANTIATVQLLTPHARVPDLVIMGSHCTGLDAVVNILAANGTSARVLALGSLGGLAALKRGECDIAPIHLLEPESGTYNRPFLTEGMSLIPGWQRMQGMVFRANDERFRGKSVADAVAAAVADPACVMVNRNQGAGTRTLIDQLLAGARPTGYWNQPRSHNAVAASIAQGRADWGIAIKPVADAFGLGFIPLAAEHYDFAVSEAPRNPAALAAFVSALAEAAGRLSALGFNPA
jgi:putative molybdopterin biosynthesis protein